MIWGSLKGLRSVLTAYLDRLAAFVVLRLGVPWLDVPEQLASTCR